MTRSGPVAGADPVMLQTGETLPIVTLPVIPWCDEPFRVRSIPGWIEKMAFVREGEVARV